MTARRLLLAVLALALLGAAPAAHAITPEAVPVLPRSFSWGVAGSAYQSEGGFTNSNWDIYNSAPGSGQDPYGTSVDFRHRYRQDIALAKAMGVNQFRFSIDWARVEPAPGVWDHTELKYYNSLFKAIKNAGMVPQPTLDHWAYPRWVYDQGAWNDSAVVGEWLTFAERFGRMWKGQGARWLTFNEVNFYIIEEIGHRPGTDAAAMSRNVIAAHRGFYRYMHRIDHAAQVSSNIYWMSDADPLKAATDAEFLNKTADTMDFIAFDYYYESVGDAWLTNLATRTSFDTPQYPQGIYVALHDLARRFPHKPIYVSENGMSTDDGAPRRDGWTRSRALRDTVYWVQRAWADGVDVRGYQYWSLTDNFEFGDYGQRFGLYTVDVLTDPTLARRPTAAVPVYKAIIKRRGTPKGYRPTLIRCSASGPALTCPAARDLPQVRRAR